ncbi:hypothetical protein CBR_g8337 [Chara braunii]|uniref:BSD domain-containing protein n=1 Tax=Chara braunii TaxID=69332 RepID=A0A388KM13_CHABU|nr:hypothetical protein CBR_g8337 [Chara braunii]|eukprot:GBG71038.1 hypothetical protein CBR_g8337 [Chara braunii]
MSWFLRALRDDDSAAEAASEGSPRSRSGGAQGAPAKRGGERRGMRDDITELKDTFTKHVFSFSSLLGELGGFEANQRIGEGGGGGRGGERGERDDTWTGELRGSKESSSFARSARDGGVEEQETNDGAEYTTTLVERHPSQRERQGLLSPSMTKEEEGEEEEKEELSFKGDWGWGAADTGENRDFERATTTAKEEDENEGERERWRDGEGGGRSRESGVVHSPSASSSPATTLRSLSASMSSGGGGERETRGGLSHSLSSSPSFPPRSSSMAAAYSGKFSGFRSDLAELKGTVSSGISKISQISKISKMSSVSSVLRVVTGEDLVKKPYVAGATGGRRGEEVEGDGRGGGERRGAEVAMAAPVDDDSLADRFDGISKKDKDGASSSHRMKSSGKVVDDDVAAAPSSTSAVVSAAGGGSLRLAHDDGEPGRSNKRAVTDLRSGGEEAAAASTSVLEVGAGRPGGGGTVDTWDLRKDAGPLLDGAKRDIHAFTDTLTSGLTKFLSSSMLHFGTDQDEGGRERATGRRHADDDEDEDDDDEDEEEEEEEVIGVTDEVVTFANNIGMHPETWLDFPLEEDPDSSTFELSPAQERHIKALEYECPRLVALRMELCSNYMTESHFWKIYFVLLHSRLSEREAALLSTPQVVEARLRLIEALKNKKNKLAEEQRVFEAKRRGAGFSSMGSCREDSRTKEVMTPDPKAQDAAVFENLEGLQRVASLSDQPRMQETSRQLPVGLVVKAELVREEPPPKKQDVEKEINEECVRVAEERKTGVSATVGTGKEVMAKQPTFSPAAPKKNSALTLLDDAEVDEWLEEEGKHISSIDGGTPAAEDDEDVSFSDLEDEEEDDRALVPQPSVPLALEAGERAALPTGGLNLGTRPGVVEQGYSKGQKPGDVGWVQLKAASGREERAAKGGEDASVATSQTEDDDSPSSRQPSESSDWMTVDVDDAHSGP